MAAPPAPVPSRSNILYSLSILAGYQSECEAGKRNVQGGHGLCIANSGVPRQSLGESWEYDGIEVFALECKDPQWIHAVASSERSISYNDRGTTLDTCEVHCRPPVKKMKLITADNISGKEKSEEYTIIVDLNKLTAERKDLGEVNNYAGKSTQLLSGSQESVQTFFPLAVDDYFMSVAIMSQWLSNTDQSKRVGACIVSNESLRVVSLGYSKDSKDSKGTTIHAELNALLNAKVSRVDLTQCSLYTTKPPCLHCTQAILEAGIRVVVYGDVGKQGLEDDVKDRIYQAKGCFNKYECFIRINDGEKKFLIDLSSSKVFYKQLLPPPSKDRGPVSDILPSSQPRPSYRDFFMAMAFLSRTRAKDNRYQVGACLVTPAPHHLVALSYNGMPDGRGFKDDKMDWGTEQSEYNCHSEVNAFVAAFRREADLSACTLYVTLSPCHDCSKLVAQSGIKNVVFAQYFHKGKTMYETLGRLPDMNIMRYEYMKTGYGNIAKMTIDLRDLSITLGESRAEPETGWEESDDREQPPKGRRDIDFPLDDYFMSLAVLAKCRSPFSEDKRFGACLVYKEPRRAISIGYSGYIDGLSDGKKTDENYVCCAEFNAIVSAFRYHADLTSATLYTTGVPCPRCAIKIIQSGIKTVVYGGDEKLMKKEAKEVFYWGKIATLKYKVQTKKPIIEIDLHGLVVEQKEQQGEDGEEGQE